MIKPIKYEKEKINIDYKIAPSTRENRAVILDYMLRMYSIISGNLILKELSSNIYRTISMDLNIPTSTIQKIIEKFLLDLIQFRIFFNENRIRWDNHISKLNRIVRVFLYKIYRLAPVFDYKRAKTNLERLHQLLNQKSFWPKIYTQVALVIYITDKNDKGLSREKKILQKNVRALCNCSAYAFHRSRNILGIQ